MLLFRLSVWGFSLPFPQLGTVEKSLDYFFRLKFKASLAVTALLPAAEDVPRV